ncbi:ribonuclease P protein subunit p30-like [Tubulanus polymorphus]|uniref:ribonuclease P protein subunit p30-like n=1 Tax=Tubulanus polymorphus TaxID=672921 RepID=UPI003DA2E70E
MAAPMDLGVTSHFINSNNKLRSNQLKLISKLGYRTVALDNFVEDLMAMKKSKKGKNEEIKVIDPESLKIPVDKELEKYFKSTAGGNVKQYTRLTTVLHDPGVRRRMQNPDVQKYDILAVQPTDDKMFLLACQQCDVDIISLKLTSRLDFNVKRKIVKLAVERGIHFEISYSPMITDSSSRQQVLSNALELNKVCKGKNIIISSQSEKFMGVRSYYDVKNLCCLFGMSEKEAKDALTVNCAAVLKHAAMRKNLVKGALYVRKLSEPSVRMDTEKIDQAKDSNDNKQSNETSLSQNMQGHKRKMGYVENELTQQDKSVKNDEAKLAKKLKNV